MNAIVDRAILAILSLPALEQEALARELLERIAADAHWEALLADPRSQDLLAAMAQEAGEDTARGRTTGGDPSDTIGR